MAGKGSQNLMIHGPVAALSPSQPRRRPGHETVRTGLRRSLGKKVDLRHPFPREERWRRQERCLLLSSSEQLSSRYSHARDSLERRQSIDGWLFWIPSGRVCGMCFGVSVDGRSAVVVVVGVAAAVEQHREESRLRCCRASR